ncbi:MAG: NAD-dependent epimerase/dehydratase family protein [Verrucomicrobiales bacterium]
MHERDAKVVVTGASGFIGSKLMASLREAGVAALGVGRRPLESLDYRQVDLSEPFTLTSRPETVVHAAALSSPWGRRSDYETNNVEATRQVIDYCQRTGWPRLVYLSSSSVYYENADQLDISESTPLPRRPINLYAETKKRAEALVAEYEGPRLILRPRAVFGPGDSVVFPRIVTAARTGKLPLLVRSGPPVLGDLIYIDNLTDILLQSIRNDWPDGCINLTNHEPVPIIDFLLQLLERLGIPRPRRQVRVHTAMVAAGLLETLHRLFLPGKEPPITRFGVSVFAYSKTFDVSKMLGIFGPPRILVREGVERFVQWVEDTQPY